MPRSASTLAALVVVAAVATGCSAETEPRTTVASTVVGGSATTATTAPAAAATSTPAPPGAASAADYTASSPPPAGFRRPDFGGDGPLPLTISIDPGCVEHGATLSVAAKSSPGMYVSTQILWPNGDFEHTTRNQGTTDGGGRATWKIRVEPNAQQGKATLLASVRDPDAAEQGTSGSWHFVVVPPGGCAR